MKNRIFNAKLKHTWENYQKIEEQYDSISKELTNVFGYIERLPTFNKQVWIMYCEYNSLRKVADETNCNKNIIDSIVKKIKEDLKELIIKDKKKQINI